MAELNILTPDDADLGASLDLPSNPAGIVVFAHGSGSSRLSPRNRYVAAELRRTARVGTLLFDLLTAEEDITYRNRFEIGLLTTRLIAALDWLATRPEAAGLPMGLFGASTGAAAALAVAAERPESVRAVVSRGGRPDLASPVLAQVSAPTLLIVGGNDPVVIALNRRALGEIGSATKKLEIVEGATHLFEEPGTLERVAELTGDWFAHFLAAKPATSR